MKTLKEVKELLKSYKSGDISYARVSRELRKIGLKETDFEMDLVGNFNVADTASYLLSIIK